MSGLGELAIHCQRRGWRLLVDGSYPHGRRQAGLVVNCLEVRDRERELLAHVSFDPANPDEAAVNAALALQKQGLIA